ncbi:MAG: hypothetical protein HOC23_02395 [Halieaceae bacterium]|jgi:hypothetical protein|nr:hypothetical protein [Halieaceae bacterium]
MADPISARMLASLIVVVVYTYLYLVQREKYLGIWALAWFFALNNYVIRLFVPADSYVYYNLFFEINTLLIGYCQLWGGYQIYGRPVSLYWRATFAGVLAWLVLAAIFHWSLYGLPYGTSSNFLYSICTIYAGWLIARNKHAWGNEKLAVGAILVSVGLINLIYPWSSQSDLWDYYQIEGHAMLFLQISLAIGMLIMYFRSTHHMLTELHKKHGDALANIIRGFIPICSYCNSIREQDSSWIDLDTYVKQHTEGQLSHGICPECLHKHYPEQVRNRTREA